MWLCRLHIWHVCVTSLAPHLLFGIYVIYHLLPAVTQLTSVPFVFYLFCKKTTLPSNIKQLKKMNMISWQERGWTLMALATQSITQGGDLVVSQVRASVVEIRDKLARGLQALAGATRGNPVFTLDHLQELAGLVMPLMASPLVGEGAAFEAAQTLATCLPDPLDRQSLAVACALRAVSLGPGSIPGRFL
jgi:hypothetical protein